MNKLRRGILLIVIGWLFLLGVSAIMGTFKDALIVSAWMLGFIMIAAGIYLVVDEKLTYKGPFNG